MCSKGIVGLLCVGAIAWAGLPMARSQGQGGYYPINGDGYIFVELKAHDPNPPNGACGVTDSLLSWTPGFTAVSHDLYWGMSPDLGPANLVGRLPVTLYHIGVPEPGTYYWRVDEVEQDGVTIYRGDVWCFTIGSAPCAATYGIVNPCCDPVLTWPPAPDAVAYHVYFGEAASELGPGSPADKGTTPETTFPLGTLRGGTTYYWRVDLITAENVILEGTVWSFTAPMCGGGVLREWWLDIPGTSVSDLTSDPRYPAEPDGQECLDCFEGPTDWADNYGTRLSAWLLPPQSGDYTFWIAGDDQSELWLSTDADPANASLIARVAGWTDPHQWTKETGQTSAPITLQAGQKYYIAALGKEGGGGDNLAVSWQGPSVTPRQVICVPYVENPACTPFIAHSPYPPDGDTYVASAPLLSWQAGQQAMEHDVYFSDNYQLVLNACPCTCMVYKGRQSETTYDPRPLAPGTYYWRIDEVNPGHPASPWRGCIWRFTLNEECAIVIDDFESYTGLHPISQTWVGTPHPVAIERTIVHGGAQSMRMDYDNAIPPYYSEAQPTLPPGASWAAAGVSALSLWFYGSSPGFWQTSSECYVMSASGTDIWGTADEFRYAYKQLAGDGSITARVQRITNTNGWAKAGVMIRETLDPGSTHAMVVVTPQNGVSFQRRLVTGGSSADTTLPGVQAPYWVRLMRQGNTLSAEHSPDGTTWTNFSPGVTSVTIPMPASVYIGLAVTGHNPDAVTEAEFCPVSIAGAVTGLWQVEDVGVAQPGNDPCPLYVRAEDTTGQVAVVIHPDPEAVLADEWTQWFIPLNEFITKGVNLARLKEVAIGVGDPRNPSPDCTGRIYIDDICLR
jgi:hypothetical protein